MTVFRDGDKIIVFVKDDNEYYRQTFQEKVNCEECDRRGSFVFDNDYNSLGLCFEHILEHYKWAQVLRAYRVTYE